MVKVNPSLRRQKINVMLNEEERKIIKEKAIQYGYGDCLAEYIRAASIYENIYVEDVEGKTEICNIVSQYIEIVKEISNNQQVILKNLLLSHSDIELISSQNEQIIDMIDSLSRCLISILSVNGHYQTQKRKTAIDNHKFDGSVIKNLLKHETGILILRPSNLHSINSIVNYLVFLPQYTYEFNLNDFEIESFIIMTNQLRDVAMRKQLYIFFYKIDSKLKIGISMIFKEYEDARKYAIQIKANNVFSVDEEKEIMGDNYSNDS